jgi:hypothetical protein
MTKMDRAGVRGEKRNNVFSCIQSGVLPVLGITDSVTLYVRDRESTSQSLSRCNA